MKIPAERYNWAPHGDFFQYFEGDKLMAIRFDPKARTVSEPYELKYLPGTAETPKPDDTWILRGAGIVFSRKATSSSVWLMKLPR